MNYKFIMIQMYLLELLSFFCNLAIGTFICTIGTLRTAIGSWGQENSFLW